MTPEMQDRVVRVTRITRDIITSLMEDPASAQLDIATTDTDEPSILVTLRAVPQECGRVIGSHGMIIKSIRTFCHALGRKHRCYVTVKVQPTEAQL